MSILPPEVRAGYVYNRVLRAIGDRPEDVDRFPDGIPARGTVTFTPKNSVKQVVSNNTGVTVTREPVVCTIHQGEDNPDLAGLLIDEAGAVGGVWLVVGEWTVSYQFDDRYSNVPNQDIVVTEDHTEDNPLDVALVAGITPSPTIKFVVNEQVYLDTLAARDEVQDNLHNMVISGEVVGDNLQLNRHGGDSVVAGNVRGPRGPQGIQGPMGSLELIGGDNPAITVDTSVGTRVLIGDTMIYGDTGWRKVANSDGVTGDILLRRQGNEVTLRLVGVMPSPTNSFLSQETGGASFRPFDGARNEFITGLAIAGSDYGNLYVIHAYRYGFIYKGRLGGSVGEQPALGLTVQIKWTTDGTWPTTLPGTPA